VEPVVAVRNDRYILRRPSPGDYPFVASRYFSTEPAYATDTVSANKLFKEKIYC